MNKGTLKEGISKKIEDWKKDIDHLEDQLEHSQEEAKEAFEKQKNKLISWVDEVKKEIDHLENVGEEKTKVLRANLDELRVQAALGKTDALDAFHKQQKQLNLTVHNTKLALAKFRKNSSIQRSQFLENAQHTIDRLHTSFDMFRLQMDLGKKDAAQVWNEKRKDITMRVNKIKAKIASAQEHSTERWEHFSEEIAEAWFHVKEAMK